jgi:hypothetical protein
MFMGFVSAAIDTGRLEIADEMLGGLRASAYSELRPMLSCAPERSRSTPITVAVLPRPRSVAVW